MVQIKFEIPLRRVAEVAFFLLLVRGLAVWTVSKMAVSGVARKKLAVSAVTFWHPLDPPVVPDAPGR